MFEWTWHYDLALDSLVLVAYSSFKLYIFFSPLFSIPRVSWHFDPSISCSPLYFLELAPSASSIETDPSKGSLPHSVLHVIEPGSSSVGIEILPEEDLGEPVLENEFHTSQAQVYSMDQAFCYVYTYGSQANKLVSVRLC